MSPRRAFFRFSAVSLLFCGVVSAWAAESYSVTLQRYLDRLYLGSPIETVQKTYPPLADWPSYKTGLLREPKRLINRILLNGSDARLLPPHVEEMRLGLRHRRVVEIEMIYDSGFTKNKPAEEFVKEYSLIYGTPRQSWGKFWWADKSTVLRILYEPENGVKKQSPGLRVCVQLLDKSLFGDERAGR